jgi:hypothetical protein
VRFFLIAQTIFLLALVARNFSPAPGGVAASTGIGIAFAFG